MTDAIAAFAVNTYAYTFDTTATACIRRVAKAGSGGVELMLYPGHLWPAELDAAAIREVRATAEREGVGIVALNMPNIDINVAAAAPEMRAYSLDLLGRFVRLAGELAAGAIVIGPGKPNPLHPAPARHLTGHFFRALDRLQPIARESGVTLLVENMPFAFLPAAAGLMAALDEYGDDRIGVIYDVANAHFIGEDPAAGLVLVRERLGLVHFSDTTRAVYRHDPVGMGDVPFAVIPAALDAVGYAGPLVLEVICGDPDRGVAESARRLAAVGIGRRAGAGRP